MARTRACVIDNRKHDKKLRNSCIKGLLYLQWHCDMPYKVCINVLSGLVYITSLSVDGCQ